MDNLAKDAMLARKAKMSYGRWKAMQDRPVVIEKKEEIPPGWRACRNCGKAFKPVQGNQQYCDIECQRRQQRIKKRDDMRRRRAR